MLKLVREMNDRGVSVDFIKENMSFTAGSEGEFNPDVYHAKCLRTV